MPEKFTYFIMSQESDYNDPKFSFYFLKAFSISFHFMIYLKKIVKFSFSAYKCFFSVYSENFAQPEA